MGKEKKTMHGGARPGSGRKDPVKKEGISFSLSLPVIAKIKGEKKRSDLVEMLLREYYKIE